MEPLEEIHDKTQIEHWIGKGNIRGYFDTPNVTFHAYRYEKGEYITVPDQRMDKILFLIEGTVQIYGIREDGSLSPVNEVESPALIGDLEFPDQGITPLFTEVKTPTVCLALSTKEYRGQLEHDLRFLHMLLRSYADKLKFFSAVDPVTAILEERVVLYMKNICQSGEINGIERAVFQLRCSRRQLQRVLKKLCDDGWVRKIGKGRSKLVV